MLNSMKAQNKLASQLRDILNLSDHIDVESADRAIRGNVKFRGPNAWILAVAVIIASVGLNVNSIPVVIGAMLISPLMGPIFGMGLGLGVNDIDLMKSSGKNLLVMVSISLVVSFLYFLITPLSLSNPTELLARTSPTFYDVLIASFGGFAGILELCRKEKGTVISGVAIATALMPPLCTAGYGLASGNMTHFIGALYLFVINGTFIMLATYVGVKYLRFQQTEFKDVARGKRTRRITSALIVLLVIPSIWSAVILIRQNNFEADATAFVEHRKTYGNSILYDYKISFKDKAHLELFFTGDPLNELSKAEVMEAAEGYGLEQGQISIKDYTRSSAPLDSELFQEIYRRNEEQIASKDQEIRTLAEELKLLKNSSVPYSQIAQEIFSIYPAVSEISLSRGKTVNRDLTESDILMVNLHCTQPLSEAQIEQMKEWLKTRLGIDKVILTLKH